MYVCVYKFEDKVGLQKSDNIGPALDDLKVLLPGSSVSTAEEYTRLEVIE